MKFEIALATVLATESLSSSVLALQDASTSLVEQEQRKIKAAHTIHKLSRNLGKKYPSSQKAQGKRKNEGLARRLTASAKAKGLNAGILSSVSSSKLQNGGSSVGGSSTSPDLGIFASAVSKGQSKVEFSNNRRMQNYLGNVTTATCPGYTDACDCSSACLLNSPECACDEGLACCSAYFDYVGDVIDMVTDMLNRPIATAAEYYCQYLSTLEGACTECQVTDFIDPDTGLATDSYDININCPNIPPELSEGESLAQGFMAYCTGAAFCDEGSEDCPPLCSYCSVDVENNIISGQKCLLEGGIGNALEDALEDAFDDIEDSLEEVEDAIQDLYARPLANLISYSCYALEVISLLDPETPPYCTTCEVVDMDTGNYNVDMICPNFASAGVEMNAEADQLFLYLGFACDSGLCESCNLDQENFTIDLNNCHIENMALFTATSPTSFSSSSSTSPPEIEDPVDVVIISKDGPETADEPETETGASESESGGHSPRSTLLALMLVGASWCWMAA